MNSEHTREVRRDVLVVVTGAALILLSTWLPNKGDEQITGVILIVGMLAYIAGLWAMTTESRSSHWALVALGLFLIAAPILMDRPSGTTTAATTAMVAGVIVAGVGTVGLLRASSSSTTATTGPRHRLDDRQRRPESVTQ
ncbi:SPW repeat domain-containing protein [Rhodococcus kronopolitis]|uniref:SPW repeat domain-containing protein n=1 Tax=Rhodococcus kronopolitis TaxID=1460226 RepID=UPI0036722775